MRNSSLDSTSPATSTSTSEAIPAQEAGQLEENWQMFQEDIEAKQHADAALLQIAQEEANEAGRLRAEVEAKNDEIAKQRQIDIGISEEAALEMNPDELAEKMYQLSMGVAKDIEETGYLGLVWDEKVKVAELARIEQGIKVRGAHKNVEFQHYTIG